MTAGSIDRSDDAFDRLSAMPAAERADAVTELLHSCPSTERLAILQKTAAILSGEEILGLLRNEEDEVLRSAGFEMLKWAGNRTLDLAISLLDDIDEELVLHAVVILDSIGSPAALDRLLHTLDTSDSMNVRQAAIVAIGHLRDPRSVPHLLKYLHADPWLQMAAVQALGDVGCPTAVPALKLMLSDGFISPLVIESLARIGGEDAFRALADYWSPFLDVIDAYSLETLADAAETMESHIPAEFATLRSRMWIRLRDASPRIRTAAARAMLALGPDPGDQDAVSTLAQEPAIGSDVPRCLARRQDLIPSLQKMDGKPREWGTQLMGRYRKVNRPGL